VLVPTYNNSETLANVLQEVLNYTDQIIVVNDGSTDNTSEILQLFPQIHCIQFPTNKGKGKALIAGFRKAIDLNYDYAITIDSDGQHFPNDLPVFLKGIEQHPRSLFIGARNMNQEHIPGKSSFGNRFSNFWFWVETRQKLPDTQSGYRSYPLAPIKNMRFYTSKYELEIEAPVRISWKGVPVRSVPIAVFYPPAEERISHFRPFKDFARISILNTFLTLIALLWIHPRDFIRALSDRRNWKMFWNQIVVRKEESNYTKAKSIGFGIFMGIVPVWGFQLLIGIPLAVYFKMNKALFLLAANISVFPLTPIFLAASLILGKICLGYSDWSFQFREMSLQQFKEAGIAFFLGGTVLALVCGGLSFLLAWILLQLFRKKRPITTEERQTSGFSI